MSHELDLISGYFFDYELPEEHRYLLRYFKTKVQRQFVRYYLIFRNMKYFVHHTGYFCKIRFVQLMVAKFNFLEKTLKKAKMEGDIEKVALIKSGKFKYETNMCRSV